MAAFRSRGSIDVEAVAQLVLMAKAAAEDLKSIMDRSLRAGQSQFGKTRKAHRYEYRERNVLGHERG